MKTTTLFALVAAATMAYASPGEQGEENYAPAEYGTESTPSYDVSDDGSGGGGGGGGGSGGYGWGYGWGSSGGGGGGGGGSISGWTGSRKGRFGGNKWGGDDSDDYSDGDEDDDGGSWYGSCSTCELPPPGYATPPGGIKWPKDPKKLPPGPIRDHFHEYGQACSSTNNVDNGNSGNSVGCCNKLSSGGSTSGGGGLLGGLLNGLLGGDTTCTLDILSSKCSSQSSIACCPTTDSGNGFSLINLQTGCVPINL